MLLFEPHSRVIRRLTPWDSLFGRNEARSAKLRFLTSPLDWFEGWGLLGPCTPGLIPGLNSCAAMRLTPAFS